jgi:hypothetical protein
MTGEHWNVYIQFQDGHRTHRFPTPQAAYAFARKYATDLSVQATVIRPDGSRVSIKSPGESPSPSRGTGVDA